MQLLLNSSCFPSVECHENLAFLHLLIDLTGVFPPRNAQTLSVDVEWSGITTGSRAAQRGLPSRLAYL